MDIFKGLQIGLTIIGSILIPICIYFISNIVKLAREVIELKATVNVGMEQNHDKEITRTKMYDKTNELLKDVAVLNSKIEQQERYFIEKLESYEKKLDELKEMINLIITKGK